MTPTNQQVAQGSVDSCSISVRLGETALHLSARLCRATVALRLVQAMADPGIANSVGETAESMDLDGLLREAELDEAHAKRVEQGILLAAVQNHRRLRDAAEWRERLFVESEEGGRDAFAGYEETALLLIPSSLHSSFEVLSKHVALSIRRTEFCDFLFSLLCESPSPTHISSHTGHVIRPVMCFATRKHFEGTNCRDRCAARGAGSAPKGWTCASLLLVFLVASSVAEP